MIHVGFLFSFLYSFWFLSNLISLPYFCLSKLKIVIILYHYLLFGLLLFSNNFRAYTTKPNFYCNWRFSQVIESHWLQRFDLIWTWNFDCRKKDNKRKIVINWQIFVVFCSFRVIHNWWHPFWGVLDPHVSSILSVGLPILHSKFTLYISSKKLMFKCFG